MIEFLKNWVEQIAIAVIIASIFELILPNGNLKKYIKVVLGIYVIFSLISPFVNTSNLYSFSESSINDYFENILNKTELTSSTNDKSTLQELYTEELSKNIEENLKEKGYIVKKCEIDADFDANSEAQGIKKINLSLKENSAINEIEEIDIKVGNEETQKEESEEVKKLKKELAEYYEVEEDYITININ